VSTFPTVVDDAAFCGRAGEFALAREPRSEIAALRNARALALALAHGRVRELELDRRVRRT